MKFVHLSDLHIGKRVNEFSMLEDQKYILKEILTIIDQEKPDGILIAGDVYDKQAPGVEAVQVFDWFLTELAQREAGVFIISGNHDSAERLAFGRHLMEGKKVYIAPAYDGGITPVELTDAFGSVFVHMLPFVKPGVVRKCFPEESVENFDDGVRCAVAHMTGRRDPAGDEERHMGSQPMGEQGELTGAQSGGDEEKLAGAQPERDEGKVTGAQPWGNEEKPAGEQTEGTRTASAQPVFDGSARNILVAHQFVTGASCCDSEELSVGGLDQVSAHIFDAFDYVALGHIHGPQRIGRETMRYCGTPLKYSFSEAGHRKSVTVVELFEKGNVSVSFHPLTPLHDMREIRGSYETVTGRDFYQGTAVDDYLHITLTDEDDILDAMGKLRAIYPNIMKLDYDNQRTRAGGGIEGVAQDKKSPLDLLGELYELQNNQPMSERQREFAKSLMEHLWEDKA